MSDCYVQNECLVCPGEPATAGYPPTVTQTAIFGWGTGADSTIALDGDLHVVFTMSKVTGAACGLQRAAGFVGEPSTIDYALVFKTGSLFHPSESGAARLNEHAYSAGDTFEIRRSQEIVTYWHNSVLVYTSARRSVGALIVSGALYASGDQIG